MTKSNFLILSLLLVLEILIGYGMLMVTQGVAEPSESPEVAQNIENPQVEQQEVKEEVVGVQPAESPKGIQAGPPQSSGAGLGGGQLANPPETIKAVYLTSWSGGSATRINYVIDLAKTTEINAVVIDVKDFSGELAYDTNVPEVELYNGENIKIWNMESTVRRLHEAGIYVIARVTVFQDPILANARPDLAVQSKQGQGIWKDYKGLSWIDPAAKEAWNYTVAIAQDAASRGFDEINFDYVRFPSDGDLKDMTFPFKGEGITRREVLKEFFSYLDKNIQDVNISADLFGLSTSSRDDLGIGQVIEDAYWHFDYVYPMVYPSHYANGYNGYANPAEYPYEVVHLSMQQAQARLAALQLANPGQTFAKLRPWVQDFDLGADYDSLMVQAQIQAAIDALGQNFSGFLVWAPTNWYTQQALLPFVFDRAAYNARLNPVVGL